MTRLTRDELTQNAALARAASKLLARALREIGQMHDCPDARKAKKLAENAWRGSEANRKLAVFVTGQ
jgi:hypothetical protein